MLSRRRVTVSAGIVAVLGLALFLFVQRSGDDDAEPQDIGNVVQPGAPGQPGRTLSAEDLRSLTQPAHTPADVDKTLSAMAASIDELARAKKG